MKKTKPKTHEELFEQFKTPPKPLPVEAGQFDLFAQPVSKDGLRAFREERKSLAEINAARPRPPFAVGDNVVTRFCASSKGCVFTVLDIYVAKTNCQTGWLVDARSDVYTERTGYKGLTGLDSGWFEKLLL